jgi:hypothetical protein
MKLDAHLDLGAVGGSGERGMPSGLVAPEDVLVDLGAVPPLDVREAEGRAVAGRA